MFRHFLKMTLRQLVRQKGFSFINILGLTIGLSSCILIGLFIADEFSYDSFHTQAARIVRVTMEYGRGTSTSKAATTGTRVGPRFKRTFPAVGEFTRTILSSAIVGEGSSHFRENQYLYADSSFLSLFSFPVVKGDPNSLRDPSNVLLTVSAAKKYFGTTDIIGKTLRINDAKDYTVSAILQDPPRNSQIPFNMIVSFQNLDASKSEDWWTANYITYLLLRENTSAPQLEAQVNSYMQTADVRKEARLDGADFLNYHLEPLQKVHLYSSLDGFAPAPNGNITQVYMLLLIAVLILAIACFNYTNLAIAQSSGRTGEIGMRKVMGALKGQLFRQFAGESLVVTFIALVLSVAICILLLPLFNNLTGKHFIAADILSVRVLGAILLLGAFIGFLAGSYPALVLSNTKLISILKSGFRLAGGHGGLRRTLIVLQFTISLFLIITTVVILQQMSYIRNKDLGLNRDHVLVLPIDWRIHNAYAPLKTAIGALPGVVSLSGSYNLPISADWGDGLNAVTDHGPVSFSITAIPADLNYLSTMDMQLLAGSDFTTADLPANTTGGDTTKPAYRYILNETAVRKIGWTPEQAIGKTVSRGEPGIIKGVVKDFHFASMHTPIGPLMLFADSGFVRNMLIRVRGQQLPQTIAQLQTTWKDYIPSRPFDYHFLDEDYNRLYTTEQRTATIFTLFAGLAIFLACLGLFGLAAISTVQRTKEIGIRKVLGAPLVNICLLISRSFLRMVVLAILIASPLAWLAANKWLDGFAYRISVHPWVFLLAGAGVIGLAFVTVSFHALRAATTNPVKSLKTE